MSSSNAAYKPVPRDEEDAAEVKKALATGGGDQSVVSSCELSSVLSSRRTNVPTVFPIMSYCSASIMMTVVNKVHPLFFSRVVFVHLTTGSSSCPGKGFR